MHLTCIFFEKGLKGGVSKRYTEANNTHLSSYKPEKEINYIVYFDVYNLYGYAMSKFLPTNSFKWINPTKFDLNKYSSNSSKGCVSKCHLEYSKELHNLYNDYFLAPDELKIKKEMMTGYQLKTADEYNVPIGNDKKLASKSFDKEKLLLHYEIF